MSQSPALAFQITADDQPLVEALKRANAHADASGKQIAASFAEISAPLQSSLNGMGTRLLSFGQEVNAALEGGASGVETALVKGFEKAKAGAADLADYAVSALAARFGKAGILIEAAWSNTKGFIGDTIDGWAKKLTEFANKEWFDNGKAREVTDQLALAAAQTKSLGQYFTEMASNARKAWDDSTDGVHGVAAALSGALSTNLVRTEQEMAAVGAEVERNKEKFAGWADGIRQGLQVAAGLALAADDFKKITNELDKQITAQERQLELIGKTAEAAAKLRAEWAAADAAEKVANGRSLSPAQQGEIDEKSAQIGRLAAQQEAERTAIRMAEQTKNLVAYVQQQAALQEANTAEAGKTAGEIARQRVEAQTNLRITKDHLTLTEEQTKELQAQYIILEATANQRAASAFGKQLDRGGAGQVQQQMVSLDLLGATPGQIAAGRFEVQETNKALEQGIPLTAELTEKIRGWGDAIRRATDLAESGRARMQELAQVGQIASNTLETAWSRWTKGAQVKWQDLANGMLQDIEKLVFKMYVLQPLFGGGSSGGGVIGQIAGSLFGSPQATTTGWGATVIPEATGGRALGGDVEAGRVYEVGENGRELFVPRASGSIIPAGGASNDNTRTVSSNVVINITAPPGTTARETGRSQDSSGNMSIDVLFEQMDAALGQKISDGNSSIGAAIQSTYGVSRAAGAR